MLTIPVTDDMHAKAVDRVKNFKYDETPNEFNIAEKGSPEHQTFIRRGWISELAVATAFPQARHADDNICDFVFNRHNVDVKSTGMIRNIAAGEFHVPVCNFQKNLNKKGIYIFCFLNENEDKVWITGWTWYEELVKLARFVKSGTFLHNGSHPATVDSWNMPKTKMHPLIDFCRIVGIETQKILVPSPKILVPSPKILVPSNIDEWAYT
jgi:hypothetical protein